MSDLYNSLPRSTTLELGVVAGRSLGAGVRAVRSRTRLEPRCEGLFSDRPSVDSTTVDAFAVPARLNARPASPYLAWVLALDDDLKELVGFMITAGVEFRL